MTASKTVLVTRPNHDITTNYFYFWAEEVLKLASKKHKVLDLCSKKANRKNFESYAKKHKPDFFFFNGHGCDEIVAGYNNEPLLITDGNDELCCDSIIYIRSCSAAKTLGNSLIRQSAKACIGYNTKFGFMRLIEKEGNPLSDPLAKLYLEPSNIVATTLLKGHSASEAHLRGLGEMKKNLRKMLSSENPLTDSTGIVLLWSNIRGQILLGDPNAII